jgi:hypothetical protein
VRDPRYSCFWSWIESVGSLICTCPGTWLCLSWKHESDSAALLRFGCERRDRLLGRGDDVAGRIVRRQSAHTRDHLQFYASARIACGSGWKPALGEFTLEQAAKHLEEKVPMDSNTIRQEAIAFPTGPSQAITYQIVKLQTDLRLLYFQTHCFILAT